MASTSSWRSITVVVDPQQKAHPALQKATALAAPDRRPADAPQHVRPPAAHGRRRPDLGPGNRQCRAQGTPPQSREDRCRAPRPRAQGELRGGVGSSAERGGGPARAGHAPRPARCRDRASQPDRPLDPVEHRLGADPQLPVPALAGPGRPAAPEAAAPGGRGPGPRAGQPVPARQPPARGCPAARRQHLAAPSASSTRTIRRPASSARWSVSASATAWRRHCAMSFPARPPGCCPPWSRRRAPTSCCSGRCPAAAWASLSSARRPSA